MAAQSDCQSSDITPIEKQGSMSLLPNLSGFVTPRSTAKVMLWDSRGQVIEGHASFTMLTGVLTLGPAAALNHPEAVGWKGCVCDVLAGEACWTQPSGHPRMPDTWVKPSWTLQASPSVRWGPLDDLCPCHMEWNNHTAQACVNFWPSVSWGKTRCPLF